jgi:carbon storage regulator
MLVVSRRPGQSILIGRDIEVFVLEVDGMQVRVGINAPRSIRVLRRELLTQVESENRRAVGAGAVVEDLPALAEQFRRPDEAQAS